MWPPNLPARNAHDLSDGAVIVSTMGKRRVDRTGQDRLNTQYCVGCKTRKSMKGFKVSSGLCADCGSGRGQGRSTQATNGGTQPRKVPPTPSGPKTWKCPNCVKRIDVDMRRTTLVDHLNARGKRCAGSGFSLPQRSEDALDYRVAGSFEGGR